MGPALIKQDPVEAKSNVQKRLEFINGELARLEGQLKGSEEKQLKKQQQVCDLLMSDALHKRALATSAQHLIGAMSCCVYAGRCNMRGTAGIDSWLCVGPDYENSTRC